MKNTENHTQPAPQNPGPFVNGGPHSVLYISRNLAFLRQFHRYSQEDVAEKIGVSRQAVAKWENGESIPDILNCDALARLYDVSVDNLIHYNQKTEKFPIPPSGKHIFGTVKVGERGQIVLPKKARDIFQISPGDLLVVLGDETPGQAGIALTPADAFLHAIESLQSALFPAGDDRQKEDSNP